MGRESDEKISFPSKISTQAHNTLVYTHARAHTLTHTTYTNFVSANPRVCRRHISKDYKVPLPRASLRKVSLSRLSRFSNTHGLETRTHTRQWDFNRDVVWEVKLFFSLPWSHLSFSSFFVSRTRVLSKTAQHN